MNYQTAISFGLVHIPVIMNSAISNNDLTFNMLHKKCGNRLEYIRYCPSCKTKVKSTEIEKGFEYTKDNYVTLTEEDFDKLKANNDKIIEIIAFIDIKEIDPIYYDKSYTLIANKSSKSFNLFKEALRKSKKVALAKTYIRNKAYYAIIRLGFKNIIMDTLYYDEEIKVQEENKEKNYTDEELKLAIKLIENMTDTFTPEKYYDEYQENLKKAIDKKIHGKKIKASPKKNTKSINDLMEALEKSLKESNGKKWVFN